jgi:hypothetical protein
MSVALPAIVEVERNVWHGARGEEPVELVDDLLGAADRERGHEQHPLRSVRRRHRLAEQPDRFLLGLVGPAAVGRLDEEVVAVAHGRRIADDRRVRPPDVAAEHDGPVSRAVARPDADDRGPEDVPGVEVCGGDPRRDLHLGAVLDALEPIERGRRVRRGVQRLAQIRERFRRRIARGLLGVLVRRRGELRRGRAVLCHRAVGMLPGEPLMLRRELLLELRRVEQHEPRELDGPARRVHRAHEAQRARMRDEAAVVEMRVREQ